MKNAIAPANNTFSKNTFKGIEDQWKAAKQHEKAAWHLLRAAQQHEAGNAEKARVSVIKAQKHQDRSNEFQREVNKLRH